MKKYFLSVFLMTCACAVAAAQELTIQSIYAPNGLTGRAPDTVKWSPDGKKVSYFLHQEQGEKADLYYIDVTSGKPAVLVASEKITAMKPPVVGSKDDREIQGTLMFVFKNLHCARSFPRANHDFILSGGELIDESLGHTEAPIAIPTPE